MTTRFNARATAFSLAVLMTLAVLGGIDFLASAEPAAGLLAVAGASHG